MDEAGVILAPAFCFLRQPFSEPGAARERGTDGDKPAHEFLIEQDRDIAEKSGRPPLKIKSITRAGAKKKDRNYSERRAD